jgi:hypothetical protein
MRVLAWSMNVFSSMITCVYSSQSFFESDTRTIHIASNAKQKNYKAYLNTTAGDQM